MAEPVRVVIDCDTGVDDTMAAVFPVLMLFLFGQRYYFRGAVLSGMK